VASYITNYVSLLQSNADGSYTVIATASGKSTATDGNTDDVFEQGETVTIDSALNSEQIQTEIVGIFEDGYIVYADGGYALFSNTDHPDEMTFNIETDEGGGTPGLPVCFTAGTKIDTPNGPVAIETLKAGDLVLTSTGYRAVKWLGWRHYQLRSPRFTAAYRQDIMPVRVRAHALADNVPSHDIVLSPWHHLYIDGVLVKANQLVNGQTIVQESQLSRVTYYHLELDQFDVVSAHNVYSESWADGGNRDFFENVDVAALRPEDQMRRRAARPGFNVLANSSPVLAEIKARIVARADTISDDSAIAA
jgi:hypothetical protein